MKHLSGITEQEYIIAINASWQLYKKIQYNFPDQFLMYVADTPLKKRLSFNTNLDRWFLIKVIFSNGIANHHLTTKAHGNPSCYKLRSQNSSVRHFTRYRTM